MAKSIYDDEYRKLIAAIRSARRQAGVTQQQLADRLGRPQSFVAKIEGYERRLDVVEFLQICRALEADPTLILAGMPESEHGSSQR